MADDDLEELHESLLTFRVEEPNTDLILVAAQKCIESGKWKQLVDRLTCPEHKDALEFVGWELIGVISRAFVDGIELDVLEECNRILRVIAETCSAKEVCIGVLEQLDSEKPFHLEMFVALLDTLKTAITRLKEKKLKCVGMVLPCVVRHIRSVQVSDELIGRTLNEEESRKHLLQPAVKHVLDFFRPLVQEVNKESSCSENPCSCSYITSLQQEILKCLIQLLDYPLVFLDLSKEPKELTDSADEDNDESHSETKSSPVVLPYRQFAQDIMQFIQMTSGSYVYVYLMEYIWKTEQVCEQASKTVNDDPATEGRVLAEEVEEEQEKMNFPALGLSCFVYLLLVEEMGNREFPSVFSFKYLLRVNMKSVFYLLSRTEHCAIYKGLELLDVLSTRVKEKSLVYRHNEFKDIKGIAKALINVMTMCSSKKLRLKSVRVFPNLVSKLDTRSQYGVLYTILEDCRHAGVAGLLIYLLKEQVNHALCSTVEEPWFQGTRLMSLLQLVFKPPSGGETENDMVQETDRIMGALNCLRFILLRDESDKTTVWQNFTSVEKNFLEPLRQALKVTRIQYQAELLSKQDEMKGNKTNKEQGNIEMEIQSSDGKSLEPMPLSDQCEALQSGLYSLDMMESVLARILEIANSRNREGK